MRLLVRYRWTGGSPASILGVVVSFPHGWSSARKGRRANRIRGGPACAKTVTFERSPSSFVNRGVSSAPSNGKPPREDGVRAGRSWPTPSRCLAVTKSLCDANHSHPPAKGGSTSMVCPARSRRRVCLARPCRRTGRSTLPTPQRACGFCSAEPVRQVGDAGDLTATDMSRLRRPRPPGRHRSNASYPEPVLKGRTPLSRRSRSSAASGWTKLGSLMPCPAALAHIAARHAASIAASSAPPRSKPSRSVFCGGEQAVADLPVGRQSGSVARRAERVRHRCDHADGRRSAVHQPQLGRCGAPRRRVGFQREVTPQRGQHVVGSESFPALPADARRPAASAR